MKKTMKVIVLIMSLFITGSNMSCSKNHTKQYEELIVGRWQLTNAYKQIDAIMLPVWHFTSGKTCVIYDDGHPVTGSYVINNDSLTISFQGENETAKYVIVNLDKEYLELDFLNNDGTIGDRGVFKRLSD